MSIISLYKTILKNVIDCNNVVKKVMSKFTSNNNNNKLSSLYFEIVNYCFSIILEENKELEILNVIRKSKGFKYATKATDNVCAIILHFETPAVKITDQVTISSEKIALQDFLNFIIVEKAIEISSALNSSSLPEIIIKDINHKQNYMEIKIICGDTQSIQTLYEKITTRRKKVTAIDRDF